MTAPLPPADLADRDPDIVTIHAGTVIHRFYTAGYVPEVVVDKARSLAGTTPHFLDPGMFDVLIEDRRERKLAG